MLKRQPPLIVLGMLLFLGAGCSSGSTMGNSIKSLFTFSPAKVWVEKVRFKVSPKVNQNTPVTVHLVIAHSPLILPILSGLSAEAYFAEVENFKKDFSNGGIEIIPWEIVPGQRMADQTIQPSKVSGAGAIIFAHYTTPGAHRVILGDQKAIQINLQEKEFSVTPITEEQKARP